MLLFAVTQFELKTDPRPKGEPRDIAALAARDDLRVVFILVDTLRADRIGSYGYARDTSPVIDYLAKTGIRFAHHHSQSSWTKTSMASLWTALNPNRTGVLRAQDALPEAARVPAEILRDAGYATIGLWRNGWVAPNFGFQQGFDIYFNPTSGLMPGELRANTRAGRVASSDIDVVLAAQEFLRTHHDRRFFLYLHLMDVHQYVTDEASATFGTTYSDSYDNAIQWTDRQIGAVIAEIERLGLRDRTLIVVASDHGEAFGEHGSEGHARNVFVEVTTTPWIISLPFRLQESLVVRQSTSNVDVWPTLLEMLGLSPLEDADGRSLLSALVGYPDEKGDPERLHFAQLDKTWGQVQRRPAPTYAVNSDSWRLIRGAEANRGDMLFDRVEDPSEQSDVAADHPEVAAELGSRIDEYLKQDSVFGEIPRVELNDMELRQLRALGYAVE
ncbi:MAG: sulfatase [Myxococcota bacterium]